MSDELTSMLPPTLASRGGSGLSLSFRRPFLFGLRELAAEETADYTDAQASHGFLITS